MTAIARAEPRIVRISDGVFAEVVERVSPLPRRLEQLLAGLTLVKRRTVALVGVRRACTDLEHDFQLWRLGVYRGLELRLALCAFCGVVEVRDISFDILPGASVGQPRRRDDLLGWYSGARPARRSYL